MKPLRLGGILLIALVSVSLGWGMQLLWVRFGQSLLVPPLSLTVTVTLIALIILIMALPVRKRMRGGEKPLDPFYATRVLALARAAQVTGAILGGLIGGSLIFAASLPSFATTWVGFAEHMFALISAILLTVIGIIAERFCQLPPDDPDPLGADAVGG